MMQQHTLRKMNHAILFLVQNLQWFIVYSIKFGGPPIEEGSMPINDDNQIGCFEQYRYIASMHFVQQDTKFGQCIVLNRAEKT